MALFPTPFVLLYLPSIYDVAYEIQCVTAVVFEKIVESLGFRVLGSKMNIADKN
jgi:hypothetical protein